MARKIALTYLVFLTGLLLLPQPLETLGRFAPAPSWLSGPGYGVHFALYWLLGSLFFRAYGGATWPSASWLLLLIAVHAVACEFAQLVVPGRVFDPGDLGANLLGGALGSLFGRAWRPRRAGQGSQPAPTAL